MSRTKQMVTKKTQMTDYKPINCGFYDYLEAAAIKKEYSRIHYFSEIHELLKVDAIIRGFFIREGAEYMQLNTGQEIRLDKIVGINGVYAPGSGFDDLSCECD